MEDLEFIKAPRENLETWSGLKKLMIITVVGIAILLSVMAATLTG